MDRQNREESTRVIKEPSLLGTLVTKRAELGNCTSNQVSDCFKDEAQVGVQVDRVSFRLKGLHDTIVDQVSCHVAKIIRKNYLKMQMKVNLRRLLYRKTS